MVVPKVMISILMIIMVAEEHKVSLVYGSQLTTIIPFFWQIN